MCVSLGIQPLDCAVTPKFEWGSRTLNSRISIELFDGEDDTYDWYEYFKNAIVFDFRKHSYTFSFYPEIGGITTCVTAEILEGQSVDASKMNTRQSSEAGSRNALRSVKLQLFFSSSLRDAVETLALKQGWVPTQQ